MLPSAHSVEHFASERNVKCCYAIKIITDSSANVNMKADKYWSRANTVHVTVRGDPSTTLRTKGLVEPPAMQPEPFDKLRANGTFLK
jgi:hypothetical protein